MKQQLIDYGFVESKGWLNLFKNDWEYSLPPDCSFMWIFAPSSSGEDAICLHELTYDKIIKLIEFLSEYK